MEQVIKVELAGALAGRHILIDRDGFTLGVIEDCQSDSIKVQREAIASVLRGGDLPGGTAAEDLRKLKPTEWLALIKGVSGAVEVPKAS